MQHSDGTSAKWYASRSFPFSPPPSFLLQLVCFCLYPSVYSGWGFFSAISSIQVLQLTKPPFIKAQRQLCTSLCRACFSVSLMFWQSADRPASTFPPRPSTPPPNCNNVSKGSSAWRWMGTLFNTTCHLSNPRLVTGGWERQSSELRCLWWEEGLDACWATQTTSLWFNFTYTDGNRAPGALITVTMCLMSTRYQLVLQKDGFKTGTLWLWLLYQHLHKRSKVLEHPHFSSFY